nr:MAG TPA: hypothetical protein [Caudoviricetes sp.]
MNELVNIEGTDLRIREWNGQIVVTFKDIDEVHGKRTGTSKRNFNRYKQYFVPGEDFFSLTNENSMGTTCPHRNIKIPNKGMVVLTESGYLMITKPFTDELSWKVQRSLVESYFHYKELQEEVESETDDADIDLIEEKPKVPLVKGWYRRNSGRLSRICQRTGRDLKTIYHYTLKDIGEKYDLKQADKLFEECTGRAPDKCMDIVEYFPELAEAADRYLDRLERILYGRK